MRLRDVLTEAATDDGVSVLVLGSTSVSAFSAGMDTKEALAPGASTLDLLLEVQWAVESFPKPLVGVFAGYVIGGGAEVALSADIRIGSSSTVFSFPGTGYGLAQGSWHLPDVVGSSRARVDHPSYGGVHSHPLCPKPEANATPSGRLPPSKSSP